MSDICDQSLARVSITLAMLGVASAMALALRIIGIYGVISYAIWRRRNAAGDIRAQIRAFMD